MCFFLHNKNEKEKPIEKTLSHSPAIKIEEAHIKKKEVKH
jgi:hypothetical protein